MKVLPRDTISKLAEQYAKEVKNAPPQYVEAVVKYGPPPEGPGEENLRRKTSTPVRCKSLFQFILLRKIAEFISLEFNDFFLR